MTHTATYSPDDNKLRVYASQRLDAETYARVKAAGYRWAPKQELFFAVWSPSAEDLAIELAGEIDDEDKGLVERAEERADRFEDYSDNRARDAEQARAGVDRIAEGIPLGQPILVGHHSEAHARRDAKRIESGMRKAVKMWETSGYWASRAKGAIRAAKYKERPDVRARRIKGLEADLRKVEKLTKQAEAFIRGWNGIKPEANNAKEIALSIANYDHVSRCFPLADYPRDPPASQYEGQTNLWSAIKDGMISWQQAQAIAVEVHAAGTIARARWIAHYENRLAYERAMLDDAGGTIAQQTGPQTGGAVRCWASPRGGWSYVQKVNKVTVTVLDNWGNGGANFTRTIPFDKLAGVMTAAEVAEAKEAGRLHETEDGLGFHLLGAPPPEVREMIETPAPAPQAEAFEAMKESLKAGVKVVTAPQLFETPSELARRVIEEADIQPGHDVLEPSAGTGKLLDPLFNAEGSAIVNEGGKLAVVEINAELAKLLRRTYVSAAVYECDFLDFDPPTDRYDRIIMNPPFAPGQADIRHVNHALKFLKPGGRLVAIMSVGVTFRQDKLVADFRATVERLGGTIEPLPAGTFKQSGTDVATVLVVIETEPEAKPQTAEEQGFKIGGWYSTEPTEQGNQCVIPGCEKDKTRGPKQMDLF